MIWAVSIIHEIYWNTEIEVPLIFVYESILIFFIAGYRNISFQKHD